MSSSLGSDSLVKQPSIGAPPLTVKEEDYLPLPSHKAAEAKFPPGCHVLFLQETGKYQATQEVFYGSVEEVGLALNARERPIIYKVLAKRAASPSPQISYVSEHQLQFAPGCSVWLTCTDKDDKKQEQCIVLGSIEVPSINDDRVEQEEIFPAALLYSVQSLSGLCKIHHGVTPDRLCYRSPNQRMVSPPALEDSVEQLSISSETTSLSQNTTIRASVAHGIDSKVKASEKSAFRPMVTWGNTTTAIIAKSTSQDDQSANSLGSPERRPSLRNAGARQLLVNPDSNPFLRIMRSSSHRFNAAMSDLRRYLSIHYSEYDFTSSRGVWPCLDRRCWKWHFKGDCNISCPWAYDHKSLSQEEVHNIECALEPVTSPDGPIIGSVRVAEPSIPNRRKRNNAMMIGSLDGTAEEAKRSRFDETESPDLAELFTPSWLEGPILDPDAPSATMILPIDLGKDFYRFNILGLGGSIASNLCERFGCTLQLRGKVIRSKKRYQGNGKLHVYLCGTTTQQVHECRLEIEQILVESVHPKLRAYTLYKLGRSNGYRPVQKNIVQTMNPSTLYNTTSTATNNKSHDSNDSRLCWLTMIKVEPKTDLNRGVIGIIKARNAMTELQERHPSCHVELIEKCNAHPSVRGHVICYGAEFQDVSHCCRTLFDIVRGKG